MSRKNVIKPLIPHIFPSLPYVPTIVIPPRPDRVPCLPFFRDPTHTIPTRNLYRSLLRATYRYPATTLDQSDDRDTTASSMDTRSTESVAQSAVNHGLLGIRLKLSRDWHKRRGWTSPTQTSTFLTTQSDLLNRLTYPDPSILSLNFSLYLSHTRRIARKEHTASEVLSARSRPSHLTGGFLRPSILNPPLPRLRPQPIGISMMMHNRLRSRERRRERRKVWEGYQKDMAAEVQLWKDLGMDAERKDGAGSWEGSGWAIGTRDLLRVIDDAWAGDEGRKMMVFDRALVERIKKAKGRREAWWRDQAEARKVKMEQTE